MPRHAKVGHELLDHRPESLYQGSLLSAGAGQEAQRRRTRRMPADEAKCRNRKSHDERDREGHCLKIAWCQAHGWILSLTRRMATGWAAATDDDGSPGCFTSFLAEPFETDAGGALPARQAWTRSHALMHA